jgi:hypothetical protein
LVGAGGVANAPLSRVSAYRVFSRLVPDRQEMVDNMREMAGSFVAFERIGAAIA